ncbi:MAG: hypothetical protein JXP73_10620 [Deltaproteobacteria bacterium]|nr:hypothetical protein [Deltaproteobacteria bacterium]
MAKSPYASTTAQVGVRSLLYLQNPDARDELGDTGAAGEVNIVLRGRSHRFFGWQVGFMGVLADTTSTSAHLLDLVAEVEFAAALNLWLGRMPIPADRTSLSTVWAIAPQTLPGRYGSFAPVPPAGSRPEAGPRLGELCRGDGAVLWGQVRGGRFKYYLGAFGLDQPSRSPLYSARVALSLLDPEPGFRNSSAYFGGKRVLGIGLGAQHRTQGSRPSATSTVLPADFDEVNADVLFEVGNEAAGVLAVEGAFARLWGQNEVVGYQLFALASYLVPLEVGIGRFQPLFRVQHASPGSADDASEFTSIDAQLGYIIDGHRIRANAGYQYSRIGGQPENAILLGVQLQSEVR